MYAKRELLYGRLRSKLRGVPEAFLIFLLIQAVSFGAAQTPHAASAAKTSTYPLIQVGGARLRIDLEGATPDLPKSAIEEHLLRAAQAAAVYYGRFPVSEARIVVFVSAGQDAMLQGTTWGNVDGFPAVTRLRMGQHTTEQELGGDWIATHELVHMSLASLPDAQHWLEEGIATYVEPIARVRAHHMDVNQMWFEVVRDMPKGLPGPGDEGLDHTHTWGRTYWGGALFCLLADIEIHQKTENKKGLQDALRGILDAGGNISQDWDLQKAFEVGDQATGVSVLMPLYEKMKDQPHPVDLPAIWAQLGIERQGDTVRFLDSAPLAKTREAITWGATSAAVTPKQSSALENLTIFAGRMRN